jgi:hypothetical protein
VNVRTFLDHAEELAADGRPAWCRSAVSRAYYAAHHQAIDFLFEVGVRTPGGGTAHVAAINALLSIDAGTDRPAREAGGDLMTLHGKRNRADYDWRDLSMEGQEEAQALVQSAREIVDGLEDCLADEDRAEEIHQHFRAWVPLHGLRLGLTLV